ncbi:MAG: hypothetical protein MI975_22960 [Cytophagales bacterium]|nr:hypothetical protein [Cytophagales bacterium]
MKNSHFLIILTAVFLQCAVADAQHFVSDKEDAIIVKNNTLMVVLMEKDEKAIKKLAKKPEELKAYEQSVDMFNDYLKKAIQNEWSYSKNVEYISQDEAEHLKRRKDPGYCLLETVELRNYKLGDFYSPDPSGGFNSPHDLAYHISQVDKTNALAIKWAASPKKEIACSYFPAIGISMTSVTFMIQHLRNQLEDAVAKDLTRVSRLKKYVKGRTGELANKTLLIPEPLLSKGLKKAIEKGTIDKFYDYQVEVVDVTRHEKYVLEKNGNYAYAWVIPARAQRRGKTLFNYFIIDAKDGRILYLTSKAVVGANGLFHQGQLLLVNNRIK